MKGKPFEMCLLFDFYGSILTNNQQELFDLYYNEDLSLAEIAEHANITRQGVRDAIVRAETILKDMEQKLGLVARYGRIQSQVLKIAEAAQYIADVNSARYRNADIQKQAELILSVAGNLSE